MKLDQIYRNYLNIENKQHTENIRNLNRSIYKDIQKDIESIETFGAIEEM